MGIEITLKTEDLLTIEEAAKQLGVHFTTVYRRIKRGEIDTLRIGGQVFIAKATIGQSIIIGRLR